MLSEWISDISETNKAIDKHSLNISFTNSRKSFALYYLCLIPLTCGSGQRNKINVNLNLVFSSFDLVFAPSDKM